MVDKAVKDLWVKALRSRKYKQYTGGILHSPDGEAHCCIGVLEIITAEQWPYNYLGHNQKVSLSEITKLWTMNDSGSYSFSKIANYIKANL